MKIPAKIKYLMTAITNGNEETIERLTLKNKEQNFNVNDEVCAVTVQNSYTKEGILKYNFSFFKGRVCDIENKEIISIKTFFREAQEVVNVFKSHCVIL